MLRKAIVALATFALSSILWAQSQLGDRSELLEILDLCMLEHETSLSDWTLSEEQEQQISIALANIEALPRETSSQPIFNLVETQCLIRSKQLEDAERRLTNPRNDFGNDDYAKEALGRIALFRNDNNEAANIFTYLLETTSFSTDIAYFLSVAFERLNEIDKAKDVALSELDRLTEGMPEPAYPIYNPDQVAIVLRYAEIFISNSEEETALEILYRGLEYNTASSELFDRIFAIHEQEGDTDSISALKATYCSFPISVLCQN